MRHQKLSLKARALAYLARREFSYHELYTKLKPYVENEQQDELKILLDALLKAGWLSNARFVESVLNRRASKFGKMRILNELKDHQVEADLIAQAKQKLEDSECERAVSVWHKKFSLPTTLKQMQKQKRFLLMRGFSPHIVNALFKHLKQD